MQNINVSKLKEQCLAILENLDSEGIIVPK